MSYRLLQAVVDMENVPPIEKAVLTVLARYADDNGANAFPSIQTIAAKSGFSERSVRNGLAGLKKLGLIKAVGNGKGGRVKGGWGKVTRWLLVITETRQDVPPCESTRHVVPEYPARGAADSIKEEIKEEAADARAPLPAYALVWQAFNDARGMVLGEEFRLPHPARSDRGHAEQFLAQGVTVQECAAIFVEKIERANRAKPPGTLAYFQKPIAEFVAARNAPASTPCKDRRHDQQYHPASGKSGRGGSVVSSETWRGCLADFVLEQSGLDDSRTAAGGLP